MSDFSAWMRQMADAAMRHCCEDGIYAGVEGAKRFAREVGPGVLDFEDGVIGSTYGAICVIAYRLKPPIDAKTWLTEARKGMDKARAIPRVPIPEDYAPAPMRLDSSPESYRARWRGET